MSAPTITIPLSDYNRLLECAESDDMIVWCETCGAWIDRNDDAYATADDFNGCWKAATCDSKYDHLCRSYPRARATKVEERIAELEAFVSKIAALIPGNSAASLKYEARDLLQKSERKR